MAILINPESESAKELARWEQHQSQYTIGGLKPGNPYVYREFPKMMYLARQIPGNGKWATSQEAPAFFGFRDQNEWDRACQQAMQFTTSCQRTVNDDRERERARNEGWRDTPQEAVEFREALDKAIGDAAAERNYRDKSMSEKALAESAAAEAEHFGHLPEIPEKPVVKAHKGWPKGKPRGPKASAPVEG